LERAKHALNDRFGQRSLEEERRHPGAVVRGDIVECRGVLVADRDAMFQPGFAHGAVKPRPGSLSRTPTQSHTAQASCRTSTRLSYATSSVRSARPGGRQLRVSMGRRVVAIIQCVYESNRTGQPVSLND
jgi:hypothetical protein